MLQTNMEEVVFANKIAVLKGREIIMCEFNRYKGELLWCTPMNAPCIKCVEKYPKIYEKIKKIAKEHERSNIKCSKTDGG